MGKIVAGICAGLSIAVRRYKVVDVAPKFYVIAFGFLVIACGDGTGSFSGGAFNPAVALSLDASSVGVVFWWSFAYTGNVHDSHGGSTYCPGCSELVIERDWYELGAWQLDDDGACRHCGTKIPGHFDAMPGSFGARRMPVHLAP